MSFLTHYTVLSLIWRTGAHDVKGFALSFFAENIIAILIAMFTEKHHKNVSNWLNKWLVGRVVQFG